MLEIESINKDSYNCFQYIVATMSNFYKCDYQMMMLELWGFKYGNAHKGNIGEKLGLCWSGEIDRRNKLLSSFHGLKFIITEFSINEVLDNINKKLMTAPLSVYLDSYECYWLPFYQKQHRPHTIILTSKGKEKYSFIDQYDDKNSEIESLFIQKNCQRVIEFSYYPIKELTRNEYFLEIDNCINIFESKNTLEQYLNFICDMKTEFKISNEIIDNDPIASKLVMYLKNIAEDRINIIEAILYIESKTNISFGNLKDLLLSIAREYEKLRAYIIKCAFTNRNPDMNKISSEVDGIFDSEKDVLNCFKSVCK